MSDRVTAAQGLSAKIQDMLDDYKDEIETTTDQILQDAAKDCAKELKTTSPKGTGPHGGRYAKSWAVNKENNLKGICKIGDYTVHNKTDYQLTHLLEYGHVGKNQYGTWGRVEAKPHIAKAEKTAVDRCINKVESEL